MNNIKFLEKVRIQLLFGGIYELIKKSNRNKHDLFRSGTHTLVAIKKEKK